MTEYNKQLSVTFNRKFSNCRTLDAQNNCDREKHNKVINQVMEGYQIVTIQNSQSFDQNNYDDPVKNEALVTFHDVGPFSSQVNLKIDQGQIETEDNQIIAIEGTEHTFFKIDQNKSQVRIKSDEAPILQFNYELSMDMVRHTRRAFTVLNALADVGGLYIILWYIWRTILVIFTYNKSENFIVGELYKQAPSQSNEKD